MFEKLGSKKYVVPLLVAVVIACVMSLMFYPMAHMEMKGLPFAVLSLDEGVETPQGTVHVGDSIVENMMATSEDGDGDAVITWTQVRSQEELDEAFESGEYYGAIIVPAGFSADQARASAVDGSQAMEASAPFLEVVIDNAKSPLVASQMKSNIASMFQQLGVDVEVETIHTGETSSSEDGAIANPMAGMLSQQLTITPLFIMSLVGALMLSRIFKVKAEASRADRLKSLGVQAIYAIGVSLVASLCVYCMLVWVAGVEASFGTFVLFMWFASFCSMLLFIGSFNVSLPLSALVAVCAVAGGMMCGVLPFEALPEFWQDWVYPWAPQRFMGEGLRSVMYLGEGAWNVGSAPLLIVGLVGVALGAIDGFLPAKQGTKEAV